MSLNFNQTYNVYSPTALALTYIRLEKPIL